jgi:hypothetical protein
MYPILLKGIGIYYTQSSILLLTIVFRGFEECVYFYNSSKDSSKSKIVVLTVLLYLSAFPVLKSCRILRRTNNNTNNNNDTDTDKDKDFDIERKKDSTDKMMHKTTTPIDGATNPTVVSNLPSTIQENNNGSTLSTTAEDDDDVTVQTSNSNPTKQGWMSYNIKLLLTNKHDTSDSALQHATLTILETIDREMGADVKIFDAVKQQVTDFQVQSATTFRSKFPVSCNRAHQKHNVMLQLGCCLRCKHLKL